MVLDTSLRNTQHYQVRIKDKVENSEEGVAASPTPQGAFESLSTTVANFTLVYEPNYVKHYIFEKQNRRRK